MRRIFIIRKDLHLSAGKMAAMVGHAAELYWIELLKRNFHERNDAAKQECCHIDIDADAWDNDINGIYTKTICETRNLNTLLKAKTIAEGLGLRENDDYGFINDKCLTELKSENEDGTTTVGMWFAPLADDIAHQISKRFPLFGDHAQDHAEAERIRKLQEVFEASKGGLQTFKGDVSPSPLELLAEAEKASARNEEVGGQIFDV